jgi:hypothetical protein
VVLVMLLPLSGHWLAADIPTTAFFDPQVIRTILTQMGGDVIHCGRTLTQIMESSRPKSRC